MLIAPFDQLLLDADELLAGGLGGVRLDHSRVAARDFAHDRSYFAGEDDGYFLALLSDDLPRDFAGLRLVHRIRERIEKEDGEGLNAFREKLANTALHLAFVHRDHGLAEHVDALGYAARQAARHERLAVLAVLHVADFRPLVSNEGLRTPALDDDVLEPTGHNQPGLQATEVDQRVEHAGAGVDCGLSVFADLPSITSHVPVRQRFVE